MASRAQSGRRQGLLHLARLPRHGPRRQHGREQESQRGRSGYGGAVCEERLGGEEGWRCWKRFDEERGAALVIWGRSVLSWQGRCGGIEMRGWQVRLGTFRS